MNSALLFVRVIRMLVFVDHRVKAIVHPAVIGEVIVSFLQEVRVFRCDDSTVEDSIADGSVNEAVFVTQDTSFVDVTRV